MRRQSTPTNATPNPLAPLDERPHRDAHLRSAARHCHPPNTCPSFMSRLERIRTIPVVYGGNRAVLFERGPPPRRRTRPCGGPDCLAPEQPAKPARTSGLPRVMEGHLTKEPASVGSLSFAPRRWWRIHSRESAATHHCKRAQPGRASVSPNTGGK